MSTVEVEPVLTDTTIFESLCQTLETDLGKQVCQTLKKAVADPICASLKQRSHDRLQSEEAHSDTTADTLGAARAAQLSTMLEDTISDTMCAALKQVMDDTACSTLKSAIHHSFELALRGSASKMCGSLGNSRTNRVFLHASRTDHGKCRVRGAQAGDR